MINTQFSVLDSTLHLERYPVKHQHKSLQAWDAADEYLIEHIDTNTSPEQRQQMLILNDDFGALSCYFAAHQPVMISDSWVAQKSTRVNAKLNDIAAENIDYLDCLADLSQELAHKPALVLIKIPRSLALLEHQLITLRQVLHSDTVVVAAGKVKTVQNSVLKLFEKYIGTTTTSLAKKKARLIFCRYDQTSEYSSPYPTVVTDPAIDFELHNHANVFCRDHLDIGARLLLQHLPDCLDKSVIDLGCGNGVLGLSVLAKDVNAHVTFVDESFMAIASAKLNVEKLFGHTDNATFIVSNCLEQLLKHRRGEYDIVLCNPPFHQQNAITDHVAYQMFSDAKQALKIGGELRIVGNRHLDYPFKLKKLFGGYQDVASNKKFSILSTYKSAASQLK